MILEIQCYLTGEDTTGTTETCLFKIDAVIESTYLLNWSNGEFEKSYIVCLSLEAVALERCRLRRLTVFHEIFGVKRHDLLTHITFFSVRLDRIY